MRADLIRRIAAGVGGSGKLNKLSDKNAPSDKSVPRRRLKSLWLGDLVCDWEQLSITSSVHG